MMGHRPFLNTVSVWLGAFAAFILAFPVLGSLIEPLLRPYPTLWRGVGAVGDFEIGQTVEVTFPATAPLPWTGVGANTGAIAAIHALTATEVV